MDLAVANDVSDDITILMGTGDGRFTVAGRIATPHQPLFVTAADLDGNRTADLVAGTTDGLWVALNTGAGFAVQGTGQMPGLSSTVAVGDFTGDGRPDLATDFVDYRVFVYPGDGRGGFRAPLAFSLPYDGPFYSSLSPRHLLAADLNADGRADLVVGCLLTNGWASFGEVIGVMLSSPPLFPFHEVVHSAWISDFGDASVGDLDGDGRIDIVFVDARSNDYVFPYDWRVTALHGKGDGTFDAPKVIWLPPPTRSGGWYRLRSAVIGDFDGDGRADVAVTGGSVEITVLRGAGDGEHFEPAPPVPLDGVQEGALTSSVVADFDGDGRSDLAVLDRGANVVRILLGTKR